MERWTYEVNRREKLFKRKGHAGLLTVQRVDIQAERVSTLWGLWSQYWFELDTCCSLCQIVFVASLCQRPAGISFKCILILESRTVKC